MKLVYVMLADDGLVKIGISAHPKSRLAALRSTQRKKISLEYATEALPNCLDIEAIAHKLLAGQRVSGEWFAVDVEKAVWAIGEAIRIARSGEVAPCSLGLKMLDFHMHIKNDVLAALDELRELEDDCPSRAEMIWRVIMWREKKAA